MCLLVRNPGGTWLPDVFLTLTNTVFTEEREKLCNRRSTIIFPVIAFEFSLLKSCFLLESCQLMQEADWIRGSGPGLGIICCYITSRITWVCWSFRTNFNTTDTPAQLSHSSQTLQQTPLWTSATLPPALRSAGHRLKWSTIQRGQDKALLSASAEPAGSFHRHSRPIKINSTVAEGKTLNIWFWFKHGVVFKELCPRIQDLDHKLLLASKFWLSPHRKYCNFLRAIRRMVPLSLHI